MRSRLDSPLVPSRSRVLSFVSSPFHICADDVLPPARLRASVRLRPATPWQVRRLRQATGGAPDGLQPVQGLCLLRQSHGREAILYRSQTSLIRCGLQNKACQTAHWPAHKSGCSALPREELLAKQVEYNQLISDEGDKLMHLLWDAGQSFEVSLV